MASKDYSDRAYLSTVAAPSADGPSPAAVREWAKSQGIAVNERGRISADLQATFQAAHP